MIKVTSITGQIELGSFFKVIGLQQTLRELKILTDTQMFIIRVAGPYSHDTGECLPIKFIGDFFGPEADGQEEIPLDHIHFTEVVSVEYHQEDKRFGHLIITLEGGFEFIWDILISQ